MKELIRFRQFLNESVSPAALIKVYQDEIENVKQNEQEDEIPAYEKGIKMLKQGATPEEANDEVGNMLVQITGEYGDPTVFMDLARKLSEGQINESKLPKGSPAMEEGPIQDFLSRQLPEEWPGSWTGDMMTGNFTAPYEHIMFATDQEDVEDYFYEEEEMINQLPTEWVKVEEFTTGAHNGKDFMVMNFAKYVPGEGIYVAATTDEIGGLNENELLNEGLNVTIANRKISFSGKEVGYIQDISRKGNQNEFSPYGIVADVMGKGSQGKSGSIAMITNFEEWMSSDGKGVRAEIKLLNGLDSEGIVIPNLLMIKKDSLNAVINRLKSEYENQLKSLELKLSSLEKI